ncbi:MAG: DUF2520 domain-containing protein [Acidobacteria bacterium]|nr:DUF2520 domain-containing protein [Acidobacteriota bacterium]
MALKLSIIGAGRVGQTLGRVAREAGYAIGDVVCLAQTAADRAVKFIGAGRAQSACQAQLASVDLFFITTPDDQIEDAVALLLKQNFVAPLHKKKPRLRMRSTNATLQARAKSPGQTSRPVVLHTSGALSSAVLQPLTEKGLAIGSCHPLQTFISPASALGVIQQTYFCLEGEATALRQARRLVKAIGAKPFTIATEMKSLYHAAAVLSSGGVTALLSMNLRLLEHCGLTESEARAVLLPLVETTLANLGKVGAAQALTGPIRRGDAGTVRKNLAALAAVDGEALEVYRQLASQARPSCSFATQGSAVRHPGLYAIAHFAD